MEETTRGDTRDHCAEVTVLLANGTSVDNLLILTGLQSGSGGSGDVELVAAVADARASAGSDHLQRPRIFSSTTDCIISSSLVQCPLHIYLEF